MSKPTSQSTMEAAQWIRNNPTQNKYKAFKQAFPDSDLTNNQWGRLRYEVLQRPDKDRRYADSGAGVDLAQLVAQQKGHIPGQEVYLQMAERELVSREADQLTVKPVATSEDYERLFTLIEEMDDAKGGLSPQQMQTTFRPPQDGLPIGIAFTGDWHLGAGGVLYKQLRIDLETIRDTDGLYAVGMGDYKENVKPQMKPGNAMYNNAMNEPGLQLRMAIQRAEIARGKWLVIADGNHDAWDFSVAGISSTPQLAQHLGVPFFGEGGGTIFVEVRGVRYAVAVQHNHVGNSRLNTTNAQRRTFDEWPVWENVDVVCLAHFHFNDIQKVSRKGGKCVYLRNGTYKAARTDGGVPRDGYSAKLGLNPEYGVPIAILYPDQRKVVGFSGDDFQEAVAFLKMARAQYKAA